MSRRGYRSGSGGGGFAGLIGVLIIVGLIIKFIWWIIGAAALVGLFYLIRAILRANARQRAILAQRMSELAARADQQHNWVMQGDDRAGLRAAGRRSDALHRTARRGGPAHATTRQRFVSNVGTWLGHNDFREFAAEIGAAGPGWSDLSGQSTDRARIPCWSARSHGPCLHQAP